MLYIYSVCVIMYANKDYYIYIYIINLSHVVTQHTHRPCTSTNQFWKQFLKDTRHELEKMLHFLRQTKKK